MPMNFDGVKFVPFSLKGLLSSGSSTESVIIVIFLKFIVNVSAAFVL